MTQRLLGMAETHWASIDGQIAASLPTDPLDLPLDRFLNLLYWWATGDGDPDEVRKFDTRLWMPPKGRAAAPGSPWSPENETAAFKSLASALNPGKAGASARSGAPVRDEE